MYNSVCEWRGILAQLGEHLPYKQRVTGSSPVGPISFSHFYGGIAQLARAHGSYPWCRWFKSSSRYLFLYKSSVRRLSKSSCLHVRLIRHLARQAKSRRSSVLRTYTSNHIRHEHGVQKCEFSYRRLVCLCMQAFMLIYDKVNRVLSRSALVR